MYSYVYFVFFCCSKIFAFKSIVFKLESIPVYFQYRKKYLHVNHFFKEVMYKYYFILKKVSMLVKCTFLLFKGESGCLSLVNK